ncbi:craniofacial development protein 2-like [Schistocerca cancellata]|uniref:craniofacial development protein 2-like n=1 Tax=Schistocerca cancellata TaxID=274614 RepID=UPI00211845E8|nr:craniofacial development protein 2-like [Schistocerca cancellata]
MANCGHLFTNICSQKNNKINSYLKYLMIGVWNVRTLQDNDHNQCPERKTGLIARELARYNINITAISETHLSDSGQLCEPLRGYTYYWSGRSSTERAESGVGFAIRNKLACSLTELPKGISDRIIILRLHLASKKYLHLINVYAPTLPSPDEEKNKFYQDLRHVLRDIPSADKLVTW